MDGKKKLSKKQKSTLTLDTRRKSTTRSVVDTRLKNTTKSVVDTTRRKSTTKSVADIRKTIKYNAGGMPKKTKGSIGSTKSKASNKSKNSTKRRASNRSTGSKGKGKKKLSASSNKSNGPEHKPKRNFNFPRNPKISLDENSEDMTNKAHHRRKRSSNISKGSKGSNRSGGKKGSIASRWGEKKGTIHEEHGHAVHFGHLHGHGHGHKHEHDGNIVSSGDEAKHPHSDDESKSKNVHFQLKYNEWTYYDYIPEFSRVLDLKLRIYMYTRIQPYKQKLYLNRKKMKEPKTIDEYGLIAEWYDINRPALLFLKYRDKCLEKIPKEVMDDTPPILSPEIVTITQYPETPEPIAPPTTPTSTNEPVKALVVPKKVKEKPVKVGSGGKPKDGLESVPSKSDKRKDQGDTNITSNKSTTSTGSNERKSKNKKRMKSIAHPAKLKDES